MLAVDLAGCDIAKPDVDGGFFLSVNEDSPTSTLVAVAVSAAVVG